MINYDEYQKIKEDYQIKERARCRYERQYLCKWEPITDEEINELVLRYVMMTRAIQNTTLKTTNSEYRNLYQELLCHLGADTDNRIQAMTKAMEIIDPVQPVIQPTYTPRYIR